MTARNRIIGIFTSVVVAGTALAAAPAHAVVDPAIPYSIPGMGTFQLMTFDSGDTYTISAWDISGACPQTLTIPSAFENADYLSPTTSEFAIIDSFFPTAFQQAPCLSTGARASSATGETHYVQIPESVLANGATPVIPAGAFQNDNLVKGFDFLGETSSVPSVGADAFTCNLPACSGIDGTPWHPFAFHDAANNSNWTDGNTWNSGLGVRSIPTFDVTGTAAVLDRKHAKLFSAVTSSVDGTLTVSAVATVKVGKKWRTREICSKTIAIVGGRNTLIYCTAGQSVRASIRLRKIKVRQVLTFTQGSTGRELYSSARITINRTK